MKVMVGTDIIEVKRIQKCIEDTEEKFLNRVFTQKEIQYCESKKSMKYEHYAARFAGKEAAFKAVSKLLRDKYSISWKNIEITNEENGKPQIHFVSLTKELEKEKSKIQSIDISLSHLKEYATANVAIII